MIREFRKGDLDRVAEIWLETNRRAHGFIPSSYWENNLEAVKEAFAQAELFVYDEGCQGKIQGFVGMCGENIAGIFVWHSVQSCGIGKQLMDFVKRRRRELTLCVYQKNGRALRFYQRERFHIQSERIDENTGEKEYVMLWKPEQELSRIPQGE